MERYKNAQGEILAVGSDMPQDGSIATVEEVTLYEANRLETIKPKVVTKLQMMEAMTVTDITATSNMWLNFKALRSSNAVLDDYWLSALDVNRNHPMTLGMKTLMNKTDADLDAIFLLASTK